MSVDPVRPLSEIEVQTRKAFRGAGYPWGLAEEAGRGVRWLAARGLDGPGAVARFLELGHEYEPTLTRSSDGLWQPPCPIVAGVLIADRLMTLVSASGPIIRLGPVRIPVLAMGIVGAACSTSPISVRLAWQGGSACISSHTLNILGNGLVATETDRLICEGLDSAEGTMPGAPYPADVHPVAVPTADWKVIDRFAYKTYAPATKQSREAGAGAGLTDND